MSARAVFLDRDGIINELFYLPELGLVDSPLNPDQFKLSQNAAKAVRTLNELGFKVIVVSNQPAIAKGKMTRELFEKISSKMRKELQVEGAHLDGEYYCFHHPNAIIEEYKMNCGCRKPKPGLFFRAASEYNLDLLESFCVGDGLIDVKAGKACGCKTILIGTMKCDMCRLMDEENAHPDYVAENLLEAVRIVREK